MKEIIFLSMLIAGLFFSCSKDKINPDCYELPDPPVGPGYTYTYDYPRYGSICHNPNNADEFIYISFLENFEGKELIKFDLSTQMKDVIYTGDIYNPKWGGMTG